VIHCTPVGYCRLFVVCPIHTVLCVYWVYYRLWVVFYWTKSTTPHTVEAWHVNKVSPSHWRISVHVGEGFDLHLLSSLIKITFSNVFQTLICIRMISAVCFRYMWRHVTSHVEDVLLSLGFGQNQLPWSLIPLGHLFFEMLYPKLL